ncbi:MAG: hypothetical protein ABIJ56_01600 [Pseudomonadota bacterium]
MKKKITISLIAVLALCLLVFAGCAPRYNLLYTSPPAGAMNQGDIAVEVVNQRPGDKGGANPFMLGQVRNAFGVPIRKLIAREDREPTVLVKTMVSECMAAAGYRPVEPTAGIPKVTVALTSFWCDGYTNYTMTMNANMTLANADGSGATWAETLVAVGNRTIIMHEKELENGFQMMLNNAVTQLIQKFQSPQFKNAIASMTAPALVPTPPATAPAPTPPAETPPAETAPAPTPPSQ